MRSHCDVGCPGHDRFRRACRALTVRLPSRWWCRPAFYSRWLCPRHITSSWTPWTDGIADLCGLAGQAMQSATQALLQADLERAEITITDHGRITARLVRLEEGTRLPCWPWASAGGRRSARRGRRDEERRRRRTHGPAPALHVPRSPVGAIQPTRYPRTSTGTSRDRSHRRRSRATTKSVVLERDPQNRRQRWRRHDAMDSLHRHLLRC